MKQDKNVFKTVNFIQPELEYINGKIQFVRDEYNNIKYLIEKRDIEEKSSLSETVYNCLDENEKIIFKLAIKGQENILNLYKMDIELNKQNKKYIKDVIIQEGKKTEDLIKYYFKVAEKLNDVPTLENLKSDNYSIGSWSNKWNDLIFISMLLNKCEKKLKRKNITKEKRELYNKIQNKLIEQKEIINSKEERETGKTYKDKPDIKENYSGKKKEKKDKKANLNIYDERQKEIEKYFEQNPEEEIKKEFSDLR
jgi:hypothetical protein